MLIFLGILAIWLSIGYLCYHFMWLAFRVNWYIVFNEHFDDTEKIEDKTTVFWATLFLGPITFFLFRSEFFNSDTEYYLGRLKGMWYYNRKKVEMLYKNED